MENIKAILIMHGCGKRRSWHTLQYPEFRLGVMRNWEVLRQNMTGRQHNSGAMEDTKNFIFHICFKLYVLTLLNVAVSPTVRV
jgi:hypothetical protein